jgi:hypothetical protein
MSRSRSRRTQAAALAFAQSERFTTVLVREALAREPEPQASRLRSPGGPLVTRGCLRQATQRSQGIPAGEVETTALDDGKEVE